MDLFSLLFSPVLSPVSQPPLIMCVTISSPPCSCLQSRAHSKGEGSSHGSSEDLFQGLTVEESFNLHLATVG